MDSITSLGLSTMSTLSTGLTSEPVKQCNNTLQRNLNFNNQMVHRPSLMLVCRSQRQLCDYILWKNWKMAVSAILNYYLAILDNPQSLLVDLKSHIKFSAVRSATFQYTIFQHFAHLAYNVYLGPRIYMFGDFNPLFFTVNNPQKALP